ncbi:DNA topoisomerase I [Thermosphaera chiliense]|uniref:DNA topoisomerase n=1 Tax=Thermosphaera chiliense TaxID=3402707 RepID=A0A7M1USB0_9CREN|nr:DNA topoisomerase I [Thermosphaera aggregans]QOR95175.1 DNA topoisomerase I [Thermosphaera aggregans]
MDANRTSNAVGRGSGYTSIWDLKGKVLVIAEKPKAARKIADALSQKYFVRNINNVTYFEIRDGIHQIIVASSVGHLYGLTTRENGYPVYTYQWAPLYEVEKKKTHSFNYLEALRRLCTSSSYFVNACDYDIEGSVIGYLIIKFNGDPSRAFRAKFSSLTPSELREAFQKLTRLDYEMIEAGLCRHELDWLWGINVSRALMRTVESFSKRRIILSAGRVQTPTLKYVSDIEKERNLFIPTPVYSVIPTIAKDGVKITLELVNNPIKRKNEAYALAERIRKEGFLTVESYEEHTSSISPPPPFNLGDLQEEAARIYGYSPSKTQSIAEQLYLDALISYPRTNSQKLPRGLDFKGLLTKISQISNYSGLVSELLKETKGFLQPVEGDKDDPAHPAIYPTGVKPVKLNNDQWAVYDLIVRRFLAAFAGSAVIYRSTAKFALPGVNIVFQATGQGIGNLGWYKYYPFHKPSVKALPRFREGEKVRIVEVSVKTAYTRPPQRISKIGMLRWMESVEIGTEATRATIIEKLFERKYLVNTTRGVVVTDLGLGIVETLEIFFPELVKVELTRHFERLMNDIKKGAVKREQVISEARNTLDVLIKKFNENREKVGQILSSRLGIYTPPNKCAICNREEFSNGFCTYHYKAMEQINSVYEEWREKEGISFKDYLEKIKKLKSTGKWVVEVIEHAYGGK